MQASVDARFLEMALAYIEVGRVSADAKTEMRDAEGYQNAVAYQLFHAIELFYKHMIQKVTGSVEHTHDLMKLEKQYLDHYTDPLHVLHHPFDFSRYSYCWLDADEPVLFERHLRTFDPKYMEQHLRYPLDDKTGGYSFSLEASCFERISREMRSIAAVDC